MSAPLYVFMPVIGVIFGIAVAAVVGGTVGGYGQPPDTLGRYRRYLKWILIGLGFGLVASIPALVPGAILVIAMAAFYALVKDYIPKG